MTIIVDIGGEGRHGDAWNLNPSRYKTVGPDKGRAIPRLIVGRADALPFFDASIDWIILERTPMTIASLREIVRTIAPGGTITLRHVRLPGVDRHALAKRMLPGDMRECNTCVDGQEVQETEFRLDTATRRQHTDCRNRKQTRSNLAVPLSLRHLDRLVP